MTIKKTDAFSKPKISSFFMHRTVTKSFDRRKEEEWAVILYNIIKIVNFRFYFIYE